MGIFRKKPDIEKLFAFCAVTVNQLALDAGIELEVDEPVYLIVEGQDNMVPGWLGVTENALVWVDVVTQAPKHLQLTPDSSAHFGELLGETDFLSVYGGGDSEASGSFDFFVFKESELTTVITEIINQLSEPEEEQEDESEDDESIADRMLEIMQKEGRMPRGYELRRKRKK